MTGTNGDRGIDQGEYDVAHVALLSYVLSLC